MSLATPRDADGRAMLGVLGLGSAAELFDQVPESIRLSGALSLPGPLSEPELLAHLEELAERDLHSGKAPCFAGGGIYDHYSPAAVDHLIQRGEFLTAYTSYQPEMSQGFLTAMYEFQTLVSRLYGLDVSNTSLYDAGTGLAEAALLAYEKTRRDRIVAANAINRRYLECLRTVLGPETSSDLVEIPPKGGLTDLQALEAALDDSVACVIVQQPSALGTIENLPAVVEAARRVGAKVVVCADPIAMGILQPPGEAGADIAVGEGQPLGLPMSYGGPLLGLLRPQDFVRHPAGPRGGRYGRPNGKRGTCSPSRPEQHIRRERRPSNICTNQGLCALAATIYLCLMGPRGLRRARLPLRPTSHRLRVRAWRGPRSGLWRRSSASSPWRAPCRWRNSSSGWARRGVHRGLGHLRADWRGELAAAGGDRVRTDAQIDAVRERVEGRVR